MTYKQSRTKAYPIFEKSEFLKETSWRGGDLHQSPQNNKSILYIPPILKIYKKYLYLKINKSKKIGGLFYFYNSFSIYKNLYDSVITITMKMNLKIVTLTVILGSLYYFLSHYKNNKTEIRVQQKEQITIIDKKPSKLPAPKVYISSAPQNGLGIGNNWRSR